MCEIRPKLTIKTPDQIYETTFLQIRSLSIILTSLHFFNLSFPLLFSAISTAIPNFPPLCMKNYVKPCVCEKNPDYVIFHVGTNELNCDLPPERVAKSFIDIEKNTHSDNRIVSISGIVLRNDNFNIKAIELSKMCDKVKLLFLRHSNINLKIHLNKSKLHLNRNGYEKLGKNIAVSSTYSTLNKKSEIDNEIVDHITNADLKSLRIRNLSKVVVVHLNIKSIRNKFDRSSLSVLKGMGMAVVFFCTLGTIYHPNFYQ